MTTDDQGQYSLSISEDGLFELVVRADGYRTASEPSLRLIEDRTIQADFSLDKAASGDTIVVKARPIAVSQEGSVAGIVLGREEIRRSPGTGGDIFRGLSTLPGVVSTGEFSNFSVRGRGPRDNLILIEDIPYDRTVHFDQSLGGDDVGGGGRFSIFGQNVIGKAEFQPGGWQAAYGGGNGSLLRLELAEGNDDSAFNSIKVDLAGAEYLYDGPLAGRGGTTALVSARYFNFGPLFETIGDADIGTPVLADLLVKTTSETKLGTLSVLGIYTPEWFERDAENVFNSENLRDVSIIETEQQAGLIGLTLESLVGESGQLKNIVYLRAARDENRLGEVIPERSSDLASPDGLFVDDAVLSLDEEETEVGWRLDYNQQNALGSFSAGSRLTSISTDYAQSVARDFAQFEFAAGDLPDGSDQEFVLLTPESFNSGLSADAIRGALYIDQSFESGGLTIRPGLRLDYDGLLDETVVSPRLQAELAIGSGNRFSLTAGRYIQAPRLLEIAANPLNQDLVSEKTWQLSFGYEKLFARNYRMLIEGYYQKLEDLLTEPDLATGLLSNNGEGETYGFDWSLIKRFSNRWSGTIRYSYVDAERDDNDGNGAFASDFSRPHLGNITLNWEPSDRWAFAAQYQVASGRPFDTFIINEDVFGDPSFLRFSRERVGRNDDRLPSFQSLNVRADYRRPIGDANLIVFVDVINTLGRQNLSTLPFSPITGENIDDGFSVFPQLGAIVEF